MESIPLDAILEFNPDTLRYLRKQYDLDEPGRIEEAITLLEEWLRKQEHFMKKEFPKDYLERTIIISKGSVERSKTKLEKLCIFRTLIPDMFNITGIKDSPLLSEIQGAFLPKLTSNHYRVFTLRNAAKRYNETGIFDAYRYFLIQCEYIQSRDYCNGLVILLDYSDANIMETIKVLNAVDLRNVVRILKEGYGMRIKGLHVLSGSKMIDMFVSILKQVMSAKLADRIQTHTTMDTVYQHIPKHILPEEYGGSEKPLQEIHDKYLEVMTSKEFTDYMKGMSEARVDEKLKIRDFDDQLMGAAGTFRSLRVD